MGHGKRNLLDVFSLTLNEAPVVKRNLPRCVPGTPDLIADLKAFEHVASQ